MNIYVPILSRDGWRLWWKFRSPLDRVYIHTKHWSVVFAPLSKTQQYSSVNGWREQKFVRYARFPRDHELRS